MANADVHIAAGLRGFITGTDLDAYDELDMKVWHWVKDKTR